MLYLTMFHTYIVFIVFSLILLADINYPLNDWRSDWLCQPSSTKVA